MALPNSLYAIPQQWTLPATDQTDFVFWIPANQLPQSFYDAIDTSDYTKGRVATNNGVELASDWSEFDHVAQTGGIWAIWTGTLSSTSNPVPRVYPPQSANASYASTATFGSEAVWVNYEAVWHMNQDPSGTAPQFTDATGNGHDGTVSGNPVQASAKLGNGMQGDGDGDFFTSASDVVIDGNMSFSFWWNINSDQQNYFIGEDDNSFQNSFNLRPIDNRYILDYDGSANNNFGGFTYDINTFYLTHFTSDTSENWRAYLDSNASTSNPYNTSDQFVLSTIGRGRGDGNGDLDGELDEVRVANFTYSANWISLEYQNQNDPATFWGTWTTAGGGGGDQTINIQDTGSGLDDVSIPSIDLTVLETGSGDDTVSMLNQLIVQEVATGVDVNALNVNLSVLDQGTGVDSLSVLQQILKTVTDQVTGIDSLGGIGVNLTIGESGSGLDGLGMGNQFLISETGTGVDDRALNIQLAIQDTAVGNDQVTQSIGQIIKTISENALGLDAVGQVNVGLVIQETATGVDSPKLGVQFQISETGTGLDAVVAQIGLILKTISEIGTGTDSVNIPAVDLIVSDNAQGVDGIAMNVNLTVSDLASGADAVNASTQQIITVVESALGTDAIASLSVNLNIQETGTGLDVLSVPFKQLRVLDTATGIDALDQLFVQLKIIEEATGTDALLKFLTDVTILSIEFSLSKRKIEAHLSTRSLEFILKHNKSN